MAPQSAAERLHAQAVSQDAALQKLCASRPPADEADVERVRLKLRAACEELLFTDYTLAQARAAVACTACSAGA